MKEDHLANITIENTGRRLRHLAKFCNLNNLEEVKTHIVNKKAKNSYLETLAIAYNRYVRYNGLTWKKPKIKRTSQPPYVPMRARMDGVEATTEQITELRQVIRLTMQFLINSNSTLKKLLAEGYTLKQIHQKYKQE
jgi:hypothetical protein